VVDPVALALSTLEPADQGAVTAALETAPLSPRRSSRR
jgi:hypothetical protein